MPDTPPAPPGFATWDEIRIAFHVARAGTVSGAAEALGVHHATVIRHVDALEERIGLRLFQRHARGYTPTEAGEELFRVARATDEQFAQLAARLRGTVEEVAGELTVTAIPGLASFLAPALARFQEAHPGLVVRLLTDTRLYRLEYGEAHVAIRAGARPEEPDNVVQPFGRTRHGLYAAQPYAARHGIPATEAELARHSIIGPDGPGHRAPFLRWLWEAVPAAAIRFRSADIAALEEAVVAGAGIGFLPCWRAAGRTDLVTVFPPRPEWDAPLWLVTHVDLHRSAKVQAALAHLKADAAGWPLG
jgi:DNA-binding transcriptional LysR family regulator